MKGYILAAILGAILLYSFYGIYRDRAERKKNEDGKVEIIIYGPNKPVKKIR